MTVTHTQTARIISPGSRTWNGSRIVTLPPAHYAILCEACEFYTRIPVRLGPEYVERIRRQHLITAHAEELEYGQMSLTPPAS